MMDRFSLRTLHWRRKFWAMLEPPEFELHMFGPPVNQNKTKKRKGSVQQIKKVHWRATAGWDKGPSSDLGFY
jgi:hypothetical protein